MRVGASLFYLGASLAVLWGSWGRARVSFECAIVLLLWFAIIQVSYEHGAIESVPRVFGGAIVAFWALWLTRRHPGHWLPWLLIAMAAFQMVWAALYGYTPLSRDLPVMEPWVLCPMPTDVARACLFKGVGNVAYLIALLGVVASWYRRNNGPE